MKITKTIISSIVLTLLLGLSYQIKAEWRFINSNVAHQSQKENWSCGPTTIAMWAGSIRRASLNPLTIADNCCGRDGTTIPEFMKGMFNNTPYGYVFSEWEYSDPEAAVKGVMWSVARFGEPVAVAGGSGTHYILIRGGRADYNPYTNYNENNHIRGVYVNDSTEGSPHYSAPVSGMYRGQEYPPEKLMRYWTKIGYPWDKKHRSIERGTYKAWDKQGKTYENNNVFTNF
ncbi:MAG TPA: hypothetical protein VF721_15635 [Pyrinomonadaceae bacterium]|jgi:hypothetical protein